MIFGMAGRKKRDLRQLLATAEGQWQYMVAQKAIHDVRTMDWYDRNFHKRYAAAKIFLETIRPDRLDDFSAEIDKLQTCKSFTVPKISQILDCSTFEKARRICRNLTQQDLDGSGNSGNEMQKFGRHLFRDHPFFAEIQCNLVELVSHYSGCPVAPTYNFLSLYGRNGRCDPHLDNPSAQWTLDICLEQSGKWPIAVSEVVDWPNATHSKSDLMQVDNILEYTEYELDENDAIIFSGSSQWHYREVIEAKPTRTFCNLIFLHYMDERLVGLEDHCAWSERFSIPELSTLMDLMDGKFQ